MTFGNSISYSIGDIRQSFIDLIVTTQPATSALFGGIEDISLGGASYFYNSAPFGNCGLLNAIGASYLSYAHDAEFRFRYSMAGHVITEVDFGDGWRIVETYGRDGVNNLLDPTASPDEDPFYTLQELQEALFNGDPTGIWLGIGANVRNYYGASGAEILPVTETQPVYTNSRWLDATLSLGTNETAILTRAPYSQRELYGVGALNYLDQQVPEGLSGATVTRTTNPSDGGFEHIELSYAIADVKLQLKPGAVVSSLYGMMAHDGAKVYPVAPTGTVALPGFTPTVPQSWLDFWHIDDQSVAVETVSGGIVSGINGGVARVVLNEAYQNAGSEAVRVWIPVAFRTDTPMEGLAAGAPIATLHVGDESIELFSSDLDLHYRDVIATVPAGATVEISLEIAAGRTLEIVALGTETDVSSIISPDDTVMAAEIDLSALGDDRAAVDIVYSIVGEGSEPPTGLATNDALNAPLSEGPMQLTPWAINEFVVTRDLAGATGDLEHIEAPFVLTGLDYKLADTSAFDASVIREAIKVYATPPDWAVSLPQFQRGTEQDVLDSWYVSNGTAVDVGRGILLSNDDGKSTLLRSQFSYVNETDTQQFLWIPVAYRTETPTRAGDGYPVASLFVGQQRFNFYTTDFDVHYKDILVAVAPGEQVSPFLAVNPGKTMELFALGTSIDVSDFISPVNTVQAVDIDLSGLGDLGIADYRQVVDLQYTLMVNPYLSNEVIAGTAGGDVLTGSDADNEISGGLGDDVLAGAGGDDVLSGGDGNDHLAGGEGRDVLLGGEGNDEIEWDPNDDLDRLSGGGGVDTLIVSGGSTPTSLDLVAHEFEFAKSILKDEGEADWDTVTTYFGADWQVDRREIVQDSGSRIVTVYEGRETAPWDFYSYYYDAVQRMTGAYIANDDGTDTVIAYDVSDSSYIARTITTRNALDIVTNVYYENDDGSNYGFRHDTENLFYWTTSATIVDSEGKVTQTQLVKDNGERLYTFYDVNDQGSWVSYRNYLNLDGVRRAQEGTFDNGHTWLTFYDTDESKPWTFLTYHYDEDHQLLQTDTDAGWIV